MTNEELENIIDAIDNDHRLRGERRVDHIKLLRSIEIAALREALEMFVPDGNPEVWAGKLERKIRELQLR